MTASSTQTGPRLFTGSSGFSYNAWKGPFYPADLPARRRLEFYASQLPAVEINNTFYRMPRVAMLEGWAAQVPESFRFVLKAPRRITHRERLAGDGESVRYFAEAAGALGARLGLLFFQLPPSLRCDLGLLASFLDELPQGPRVAFEFRHASWNQPDVEALLRERGIARVVVDSGDGGPDPLVATASAAMLRLRGPDYPEEALRTWVEALRQLEVEDIFVFFKHEDEGIAPRLAARMEELWNE